MRSDAPEAESGSDGSEGARRPRARTGAQVLVDQLIIQGVEHVFGVPGESYLAVLDALRDSPIALTVCRQEGGAAMMAEASAKLTGCPGICFVTRGPGATNASPGVHVARQDSTPLILFVGQVARDAREREAFQELDYRAVFGSMTKWATEIDDPARIPEILSRAFHTACNGRPGPVVIALPEDMLRELTSVGDARPCRVAEPSVDPDDVRRLAELLDSAERPLLILGGSRWDQGSVDAIAGFAHAFALPAAVSFRRQSLFPATHASHVGDLGPGANPKLVAYARSADLIILLGTRFSELASQGYTIAGIPVAMQRIVHVHPGAEELGRVYAPELAINASPKAFARAVEGLAPGRAPDPSALEDLRAAYIEWSERPTDVPGAFNLGAAICALRERLPENAVICNGAGNYATWVHRFYRFRRFGTQLAPTSGSMGYGVPAAVAAARLDPSRPVIAFAGDGCFLMNGQEFATAIQHKLPIIVVVVDNGMYGTIRMHQEREYPGRVVMTGLTNPDFAAYARAFGGYGERVERTEDFAPAFERARQSGLPAILHCIADPEAITPGRTLSAIRQGAERARAAAS